MATTNLSPRQRMINMMYIVLIAMLALNVDRHVLKAFHLMEKNFITSAESYDKKNAVQMAGFAILADEEKEKATPYYEAAQNAQRISSEFDLYIEDLKSEIIELYDGRLEEEEGEDGLTSLKSPEGMEKHAYLFMVKEKGKRAKELQLKINSTRDKLLDLLKPAEDKLFVDSTHYYEAKQSNLLDAKEPATTSASKRSWASINLEYQPVGALIALLTQYQNNAKALESDIIGRLIRGVNSSAHIIDELNAAIIPQSNYVMEGEKYTADVMLIARSSSAIPKITMNGSPIQEMNGGVGKIDIVASGVGQKTVSGEIELADPKTGEPSFYKYEHKYQVFKPVATVSPTKMNLLYIGLDNPLNISVPGFSAADINVSTSSGATISGSNGTYKVKVDGSKRKVHINVTAKGRSMGSTEFRVRNIPEPEIQIGGVPNDGRARSASELCAQNRILASLGKDFAYDMQWRVTKFQFIYVPRRGNAIPKNGNGSTLTREMKDLICHAQRGDIILIQNVKAKDTRFGNIKSVPPMTVQIR